jgi:hypothetical protein
MVVLYLFAARRGRAIAAGSASKRNPNSQDLLQSGNCSVQLAQRFRGHLRHDRQIYARVIMHNSIAHPGHLLPQHRGGTRFEVCRNLIRRLADDADVPRDGIDRLLSAKKLSWLIPATYRAIFAMASRMSARSRPASRFDID